MSNQSSTKTNLVPALKRIEKLPLTKLGTQESPSKPMPVVSTKSAAQPSGQLPLETNDSNLKFSGPSSSIDVSARSKVSMKVNPLEVGIYDVVVHDEKGDALGGQLFWHGPAIGWSDFPFHKRVLVHHERGDFWLPPCLGRGGVKLTPKKDDPVQPEAPY